MNQINDIGNHYLYRHIRLDKNEPFYIGIGTKRKDYKKHSREYTRAYSKKGRNYVWKGIAKRSDYSVEILLESNDYDFINQKEKEFIFLYGKIIEGSGTLANFTDGGGGVLGYSHDEETKKGISKNSTQYKVAQYSLSGEFLRLWDSVKQISEYYNCTTPTIYSCINGEETTCQDTQMLKIFTGDKIPKRINEIESAIDRVVKKRRGFKHSKDTIKKMSEAQKGKVVSEETKKKLRQHNLGNTHTEETKKKLSKLGKGRKFSKETRRKIGEANSKTLKGRKLSDEVKQKISDSHKKGAKARTAKRVRHIPSGKVFGCLKDAAKWEGTEYKLFHSRISRNTKNNEFEYIDE